MVLQPRFAMLRAPVLKPLPRFEHGSYPESPKSHSRQEHPGTMPKLQ